jgi:hypothetical protein
LLRAIREFTEAWERWEFRPTTVLDLGDRLLALGTVRLPGTASGLELERQIAQLMTRRGGLVAHEQDFLAWDTGLRAARARPRCGCAPDARRGTSNDRPDRGKQPTVGSLIGTTCPAHKCGAIIRRR